MFGAVPIVPSSELDVLYKDLPVIIVKDWRQVTVKFLEDYQPKTVPPPKLTLAKFWFEQFRKK